MRGEAIISFVLWTFKESLLFWHHSATLPSSSVSLRSPWYWWDPPQSCHLHTLMTWFELSSAAQSWVRRVRSVIIPYQQLSITVFTDACLSHVAFSGFFRVFHKHCGNYAQARIYEMRSHYIVFLPFSYTEHCSLNVTRFCFKTQGVQTSNGELKWSIVKKKETNWWMQNEFWTRWGRWVSKVGRQSQVWSDRIH